jgi:hypothetical protein
MVATVTPIARFVPQEADTPTSRIGEKSKSGMRSVLRALAGALADIEASAVISGDGLMIASVLHDKASDQDRFAAMCASLLALARRASVEIQRGELRLVLVDGEEGAMLLVHAGSNMVLAIAARRSANLGMIFHEAKKAATRINAIAEVGG